MAKQIHNESIGHLIRRYIMLLLGASLAAVAIELFLVPNTIIDGGVIGVSLLLNQITNINFGILVLIINIPFLYAGLKRLGKDFLFSSLFSIISLAVVENLLHRFEPFTDETLLATVFGGLMLGAGVGIVIRNSGALDGTEILGIIITKNIPFSVGEFVMFLNIFIFVWAGFVLGWEQAMFSILTYYIASKTIDSVGQGFNETKAAIIISNEYGKIAEAVSENLGRGITKIYGKNSYQDTDTEVLYVVITRLEMSELKNIVHDIDPDSFITIMDTQEVHGGKFRQATH